MSIWDKAKNIGLNIGLGVGAKLYPPPQNDQFQVNGQLSPEQFKKGGDKLTQVSPWQWKPSSNKYTSKYLDQKKQYLILEKALCKKRISILSSGKEQKIQDNEGEQIVVLHTPQIQQEQINQKNFRFYTMYIIYDQYYHTPRMFFSATDIDGHPISAEGIKQDIQKQYLDKTLTMEPFPFIDNLIIPTVHPCKHANVLKSMADAMRQSKYKVDAHYSLLIFLKFITNVIPTVEFDNSGDLHFE